MKRIKTLNANGNITILIVASVFLIVGILGFLAYKKSTKKSNSSVTTTINSAQTKTETSTSAENSSVKSLDLAKLPLGDNKYTTSGAKKGYIYSCIKVGGGGGAFKDGSWINSANSTWSKKDKNVSVDGSVSWPDALFKVTTKNTNREISGNGLPTNHGTGVFPVSRNDDAFSYDRNPNSIKAHNILQLIPLNPNVASQPKCLNMGAVGYSLNGVAIFNALDGEGRDAAAHEILDKCGGHPERTGEYHYHDYSECMSEISAEPKLIGYMLDGFGLYKYPVNPSNEDLDECHGKIGEVLWNYKKQSIYHYVITDEYPYSIGCFKGVK